MSGVLRFDQLSVGALLHIVFGVAAFFAAASYLDGASRMSPSWPVIVAVGLVFAWGMIGLRRGVQRYWWIGFFALGIVWMLIAVQALPMVMAKSPRLNVDDVWLALSALGVALGGFAICGVGGGAVSVFLRQRLRRSRHSDDGLDALQRGPTYDVCTSMAHICVTFVGAIFGFLLLPRPITGLAAAEGRIVGAIIGGLVALTTGILVRILLRMNRKYRRTASGKATGDNVV